MESSRRSRGIDAALFTVALPPGEFVLVPQPVEGLMGTAGSQPFTAEPGVLPLDIAYDTGIR